MKCIMTSHKPSSDDNFYFKLFKNYPARKVAPQFDKSTSTLQEVHHALEEQVTTNHTQAG